MPRPPLLLLVLLWRAVHAADRACHVVNGTRTVARSAGPFQFSTAGRGDPQRFAESFLLVNHAQKYIGCFAAKAACTSWLTYIRTQEGERTGQEQLAASLNSRAPHSKDGAGPLSLEFLNPFSEHGRREVQRVTNDPSYWKFAVVRHPVDRLISGYHSINRPCCVRMSKDGTYRADQPRLCCVTDNGNPGTATFHSFLEGLATSPSAEWNNHFAPITDLCFHDRIVYNFVGEADRQSDTDYISRRLGFNHTFAQATHAQVHGHKGYVAEVIGAKGVPRGAGHDGCKESVKYGELVASLPEEYRAAMRVILSDDLRMLGYSWTGA